jgi:hypothetical protein
MHDRDWRTAQQPQSHEALLSVYEAIIFVSRGQAAKTAPASAKSKPCSLRLDLRLASSHS